MLYTILARDSIMLSPVRLSVRLCVRHTGRLVANGWSWDYACCCNLAPSPAVDIFVRPGSSGYATNYDRRPSKCRRGCPTLPRAWNSLPQFVTDCPSPGTFRQYLKTYLFSLSF